jgi:DNA-3-methyladenine glycosylase I
MSGLSWLTILRKRENFRAAFRDFEPAVVARFDARDVARLMADAGIVRNRAKIDAVINNARRYGEVVEEFGSFADHLCLLSSTSPTMINRIASSLRVDCSPSLLTP